MREGVARFGWRWKDDFVSDVILFCLNHATCVADRFALFVNECDGVRCWLPVSGERYVAVLICANLLSVGVMFRSFIPTSLAVKRCRPARKGVAVASHCCKGDVGGDGVICCATGGDMSARIVIGYHIWRFAILSGKRGCIRSRPRVHKPALGEDERAIKIPALEGVARFLSGWNGGELCVAIFVAIKFLSVELRPNCACSNNTSPFASQQCDFNEVIIPPCNHSGVSGAVGEGVTRQCAVARACLFPFSKGVACFRVGCGKRICSAITPIHSNILLAVIFVNDKVRGYSLIVKFNNK